MCCEYLHQGVNLNICNFPILACFSRNFHQTGDWKYNSSFRKVFAQFSIGKGPIFGPQLAKKTLCSDISVQMSWLTTAFVPRPLCAPADVLLRCRRPYCAAMTIVRRSHGLCFEHAQSVRRRLAFYTITQCPLAMPLRCCGDACDRTARTSAIYIFLGRRGIAVRTLLWCYMYWGFSFHL